MFTNLINWLLILEMFDCNIFVPFYFNKYLIDKWIMSDSKLFYIVVGNTYFWCGHCKPSWKTNLNSTQDPKRWFKFLMHNKIRKDRVHQKIWQQFWFLLPQFSPLFTVENHPSSPMWCTHAFVYVIRNTCAYMREFGIVWNKLTITSVL